LTDPRDEIDNWLDRDVTPLYPPSGSLDRIRHRARQRKARQASFAAAGCAVVLAGAVVAPQLIAATTHQHGHNPPVAIQNQSPSVQPTTRSSSPTAGPDSQKAKRIQTGQRTTLSRSWTKPPANFQPTSVTFVGNGRGGVIGAVIGQAGSPGRCATKYCTSLAGTADYGQTWSGVSAPVAPGATSPSGVSQLRFANLSDGWAYGPALYETSRGGWPWKREDIGSQSVLDVEAAPADTANGAPARAFAVFGTCPGSGANYAASCTSFSLWTSVAGSRTWTAVSVPAAYQSMTSASSAAPLLLIAGGTTGYLLTPTGSVLSGPTSGGSWQVAGQAPCKPGSADSGSQTQNAGSQGTSSQTPPSGSQSPGASGAGSQDSGAQFASGVKLLLACDSQASGGGTQVTVYTSANGARWTSAGSLAVRGTPTSLTSAANGQAVLATSSGIEYSANDGSTWQQARFSGTGSAAGAPPGGFSYVGMTDATQGVAIPADASLGEIYVTSNGGRTWTAAPVSD